MRAGNGRTLHGYARVVNGHKKAYLYWQDLYYFGYSYFPLFVIEKITAPLREMNLIAMEYAKKF
ncbi:hypothetical protein KHA80_05765 [Anaerobacillus sp. HL2]|nr:hypothetical protein KHA80_05765 [Anaerobacillus sp. HL2]